MKNTTEPFEELLIPRKDLHISAAMIYRVYSDKKNFELIEAVSALDAMAQSKIKNVYKVERHDPMASNVIHLRQVLGGLPHVENNIPENKIAEAPVAQEISVEVPQHVSELAVEPENIPVIAAPKIEEEQAIISASAASAALSNDEVEKLLNGG